MSSLEELPDRLFPVRRYFSLLLAFDAPAQLSNDETDALRKLVDRGLIHFSSWGENCERVHDAVDRLDVDRVSKVEHIIMTTWHSRESLEEAMFFFRYCVCPAEPLQSISYDRFAVSIDRPEWHHSMAQYFSRKKAAK